MRNYFTFDVKSPTSAFALFTFYLWNSCSAKRKKHSKRLWQSPFFAKVVGFKSIIASLPGNLLIFFGIAIFHSKFAQQ